MFRCLLLLCSTTSLVFSALCSPNTTAAEVVSALDLTGLKVVVTGGDGGLGYPVSHDLAAQGASVIIASHNLAKCQAAAKKISESTGNSDVVGALLDLGSFRSVRSFVEQIQEGGSLDLLVNLAGIAGNSQRLSEDGFEIVFQINYLGPFLLTHLLLPLLRSSPRGGRVVNVASSEQAIACQAYAWPANCLADLHLLPPPVKPNQNVTVRYDDGSGLPDEIRPIEVYGVTKALSIQHVAELARREPLLRAYSLTPGWVNTSIISNVDINSVVGRRKCFRQAGNPCPYSPEQGAAVVAACSTANPGKNGAYISRYDGCQEGEAVNPHGFTPPMGAVLYSKSLEWAKAIVV